jgi:hypothetical protein
MSKDVEIRYEPEVVKCQGCGKEYKASDLVMRASTETELIKLEEHAKNNRKINEAIEKLKDGKISLYEVYVIQAQIVRTEDLHKIRASNMDGEAEGQCDCNTPLKAKIHMRVLVELQDFRPSLDECRKFKMPDQKILIQLIRMGEVFLPPESNQAKELEKLMQDSQRPDSTGPDKANALKALDEKIHDIRTMSSISMDYIRSLIEPPPNVDKFVADTLEALEKTGLRNIFKNDLKECLADLKADVRETHNAELSKFLNALQRLAQINARE